jgi:hypothetical protein
LQIWAFVTQNAAIDAGFSAVHSSFHGYLLLIFSGQAADRLIRLICRKAGAYLNLTLQIVILSFNTKEFDGSVSGHLLLMKLPQGLFLNLYTRFWTWANTSWQSVGEKESVAQSL